MAPPAKWHLRDWKLERLKLFQGIREIREVKELSGYYLRLDFSMQYRDFLIYDNGGEVNIREIGQYNEHFGRSLELPIHGTREQTGEGALYYRLMRFIKNEPIDWQYECSALTEEDFAFLLPPQRQEATATV